MTSIRTVPVGALGWRRIAEETARAEGEERETWELRTDDGAPLSLEIQVTTGKPFDVVRHKWTSLDAVRQYAARLRETAKTLYGPGARLRLIEECPACGAPTTSSAVGAVVYGIEYRRCSRCRHAFVARQPIEEALLGSFETSDELSATYTDDTGAEARLHEIVRPKLEWVRRAYAARYGREPRSVLDVGAGGGHFLELCRRSGLRAEGYEISASSRRFAREAFGLELRRSDFAQDAPDARFDVVSFWGLLEYTPDPGRFLRAASRWLHPEQGMLVLEVPRFDCLGTAVQRNSDTVARHLDPTSHVNCFSDASLCVSLVRAGLRPVAAWYFGMDAFELVVQLALRLDDGLLVGRAAELIPAIQASLDAGRACDDVIVAAVPVGA